MDGLATLESAQSARIEGPVEERSTSSRSPLRSSWVERARCRGMDVELFFPIGTGEAAQAQADRAKRVCAECPVRRECLEYALSSGADDGIWGGMTPQGRRQVHLRRRRARRMQGR